MNEIGKRVTGLQHIGLPTNDMEATLAFYQSLGFTLAHQADNDGERVCFLQLAGVCIEAYENGRAVGRAPGLAPVLGVAHRRVQLRARVCHAQGCAPPR